MAYTTHSPIHYEHTTLTNKVIRNTYALLSATLLFSAAMAGLALTTHAAPISPWLVLLGYFGLLFATTALRNSPWALALVFALTGFMGYTLGPVVGLYLALPNGPQTVMTALGMTGAIFAGLSAYALVTRKDFSFMGGFLTVGILVAFLGGLGAMLFHLPLLSLVVSAAFVLLMSAYILYQTSQLVHGGETNYIMATVALYISIYNLFLSLLQLLAAFNGER
jgi:modulator of FtsH protease